MCICDLRAWLTNHVHGPPTALLLCSLAPPPQGAARTFHAFDAQRTGRITLDFSQFVYAASNVM
jgi:hypothetical protein